MVIKPKVKGFICTTAHPLGCKENVAEQISRVKSRMNSDKAIQSQQRIKNVLIIGGSTGYGLASRIVSTYGLGAGTLNVCFERSYADNRSASPGWYNTAFFEEFANNDGYYGKTIVGDAFSDEIKQKTIETIKKDLQKVDLVIYSLASAKRDDPRTGKSYRSTLKPIGKPLVAKNLNVNTGEIGEVSVEPASDEQIQDTIKVMGGEDWKYWIEALEQAEVLSEGYTTLAYSYIGPAVTQAIYRSGTIGKAKEDLENTAELINKMSTIGGQARIIVNKALVTHASSAIPILPLYVSALYKVMKQQQNHEDCLDQIYRLFSEKTDFSGAGIAFKTSDSDNGDMVHLDDYELQSAVQNEVKNIWQQVNTDNVNNLVDIEGYRADFLKLFGFGLKNIDYEQEVDEKVEIDFPV